MGLKKWEIPFHLIFWGLVYWSLLLSSGESYVEKIEVNGVLQTEARRVYYYWPNLFNLLANAFLVYFNAFVLLPPLLKKGKFEINYLLKIIGLVFLTYVLELGLNYFQALILEKSPRVLLTFGFPFKLLLSIFFLMISYAYTFGRRHFENEKIKQQLIQENLRSELQFLKAQINPHFLFNTLNNLFSLSEKSKNPELSEGIAELSNLMRYMIYETKAESVALTKEIEYLESVIKVQQLRTAEEDDIIVSFNKTGDFRHKKIAPMILVPFVENAFKHGISFKKSSIIKIDLHVEDHRLDFRVVNTNFPDQNASFSDDEKGIGLKNVKRRLDLLYQDRYQLTIENDEQMFKTFLQIDLD